MESFFSRYRNALVLMAVLLAQVIGLAIQVRRPGQKPGDKGGVRLIRSWSMDVVTPPERLLHVTGLGLRGIWTNYIDLIHVREQNRNLQAQLDDLRLEEASLSEDARQGLRLQALLGFQEKYIYKTVAAQVIGTSGTEQSHVLLIDKGSDAGLRPDMAVITPDGIVGKTRDVFAHTSQVLEISDATSGAGVIMEKTRIQGVLRGNTWGQPEIVNVSPDDRIKSGETVITSGGDAIYPRGLPVGTVDRVVPDPDGTLVNVLVKPAANLSKLEEVLIITSTGSRMPSQMQNDLSEAQQSAAEILAAKLPSRDMPPPANPQPGMPPPPNPNIGTPPLPKPPPPPLHADRYSPLATPPATDLVPGQRFTTAEGGVATPESMVRGGSAGATHSEASRRAVRTEGVAGESSADRPGTRRVGEAGRADTANPAKKAAPASSVSHRGVAVGGPGKVTAIEKTGVTATHKPGTTAGSREDRAPAGKAPGAGTSAGPAAASQSAPPQGRG